MICRLGTVALLLAGAASVSGCMALGGNVKGTFACAAPEMGSCAPSSVIDDRALAMIVGEAGDSQVSPAGPYPTSSPEARSYQAAAANPSRTGEKVLRIVFPSHIDPQGRLHDQMSVHAVVDRGDWQSASSANAVARSPEDVAAATGGDTLLAAVERAETPVAEIDPDMPSADSVAAARARAQVAPRAAEDPIGAIRDDVAKRLANAPRRTQAATVRSSLGPTPSNSASAISDALPASATARSISPAIPAAAPSPALPRSTPGTIIPAEATDKGRAAVEAVNQNPVIRSATSSVEAEARSSKTTSPVTTLRASPFPGLKGDE